jgi:hypothetical protein
MESENIMEMALLPLLLSPWGIVGPIAIPAQNLAPTDQSPG